MKFQNWISLKGFIGLFIVLALVATGLYVYQTKTAKDLAMGRDQLFAAQKKYEEEFMALPENQRSDSVKLDVDQVFKVSLASYEGIAKDAASASVRFEAAMRLATLYLQHDLYSKAISWAQSALKASDTNFKEESAMMIEGIALERSGDMDGAVKLYQKIIQSKGSQLKGEVLLSLIRINIKKPDVDQARKYFEQLKELEAFSSLVPRAESMFKFAGIDLKPALDLSSTAEGDN